MNDRETHIEMDRVVDSQRILIVEDDPIFNKFLEQALSDEGYRVLSCAAGRDAIDILQRNPIDVVLLDIGLPDMSGYEVIESIPAQYPEPMFFVMTGNGTLDSALEALRQRVYNFLVKPFDLIKLKQELMNALYLKELNKERLKVQEELRESQNCLKYLIENSIAGIGILQDKKIVYSNSEFDKIFKNFVGSFDEDFYCLVHPDDALNIKIAVAGVAKGENPAANVTFRFFPSGNVKDELDQHWFQVRISNYEFKGRKALLFNVVDITNTKLIERQLIIKNKMFSLGQVAAGVAHEIRNPLTGINGYLFALDSLCKENFSNNGESQIMQEIIDQIQDASSIIESVIKRVMDFSKPGTPKMKLIDVNESLHSAIRLSTMAMRKYKIKIETALDDNLPKCYADSNLIEQVIVNLLSNASGALQEMKGDKTVLVESLAKDNNIYVIVSDSGPGIPVESRGRIFEPFFSTKEEGSGIGLNIVQRIIADHNGSIGLAESKLGGAAFKIEIPIERRISPR